VPSRTKPRRGILIIGAAAAVVLVLLGVSAFFLLRDSGGGANPFPVGSCVKQSGGTATAARCTDAGAFVVVSNVDSVDECNDKSQPYLQLSGTDMKRILCLAPAAGSGGASPSPSAQPSSSSD